MTKLIRFDPIKTRDDIKIFDEVVRQRDEERARRVREVEESNLKFLLPWQ